MAQAERLQHRFFRNLMRAGLNHDDRVLGAGHDQVEVGFRELLQGRVDQQAAVDHAHSHAADRPRVGNAADLQRDRRTGHGQGGRVLLLIGAEHGGDDLDVVAEVLGKQRSHGPVDHPAGQDRGLGGPAFAPRKRPRDAAGSVELLLVVTGQRKKVDSFSRSLRGHSGDQENCVARANHDRAVGLLGHVTGFNCQALACQLSFEFLICHMWVSSNVCGPGDGGSRKPAPSAGEVLGAGPVWGSRNLRSLRRLAEAQSPTSHPRSLMLKAPAPGCSVGFGSVLPSLSPPVCRLDA